MSRLVLTSTVLARAAPEAVWSVLTDAAAWPRWCTPVRAVHVVPERWRPGEPLSYTLAMGPGVPVRFDVTLTEVVPNRLLAWTSTKWWGVRGTRTFAIEAAEGGCRVTDTKVFESRIWPVASLYPRKTVQRMSERWLADLAKQSLLSVDGGAV